MIDIKPLFIPLRCALAVMAREFGPLRPDQLTRKLNGEGAHWAPWIPLSPDLS